MESKRSGGGFSFLILVLILVGWYVVANIIGGDASDYTYSQFQKDMDNQRVAEVFIGQNKEVPTGYITVLLKNGETVTCYVADVNEAVEFVKETGCVYTLGDVERDSVFLTIVLPIMLGVMLIVFVFLFPT